MSTWKKKSLLERFKTSAGEKGAKNVMKSAYIRPYLASIRPEKVDYSATGYLILECKAYRRKRMEIRNNAKVVFAKNENVLNEFSSICMQSKRTPHPLTLSFRTQRGIFMSVGKQFPTPQIKE